MFYSGLHKLNISFYIRSILSCSCFILFHGWTSIVSAGRMCWSSAFLKAILMVHQPLVLYCSLWTALWRWHTNTHAATVTLLENKKSNMANSIRLLYFRVYLLPQFRNLPFFKLRVIKILKYYLKINYRFFSSIFPEIYCGN